MMFESESISPRQRDRDGIKKVAIIGMSPSTHDDAPWDDPEWEIWGLPWDEGYWHRMDRCFEMHDISLVRKRPTEDYLYRLQSLPCCYMQEPHWPNITQYPLESVIQTIRLDYFNSSIAYMIALAIHEGFERMGLWGIELRGLQSEYTYQRPNAEWLLGIAMGRGMDVEVAKPTTLLRFEPDIEFCGEVQHYADRYGYL